MKNEDDKDKLSTKRTDGFGAAIGETIYLRSGLHTLHVF